MSRAWDNQAVNVLPWNPSEKVLKPNLHGRLSCLTRSQQQA